MTKDFSSPSSSLKKIPRVINHEEWLDQLEKKEEVEGREGRKLGKGWRERT